MTELHTSETGHIAPLTRHTFGKEEHLYLRNDIESLFSAGSKSVNIFPIRAVYRLEQGVREHSVKVMVSVSKRRLRHAVDRNRAKRQMREAYRLQKEYLVNAVPEGYCLNVGFIWLPSQPLNSPIVHQTIQKLMLRIGENIRKTTDDAAVL